MYQNWIHLLTHCYLTGGGLNSKSSGKTECASRPSSKLEAPTTAELDYAEAEQTCVSVHGTLAVGSRDPDQNAYLAGESRRRVYGNSRAVMNSLCELPVVKISSFGEDSPWRAQR